MTKRKEDEIVRLLMQIQAIWEQEHPGKILSMAVSKDYLSAFSMTDDKRYIMDRTIVGREAYEKVRQANQQGL